MENDIIKWNKVTEKLPKNNQHVLIIVNGKIEIAIFEMGKLREDFPKQKRDKEGNNSVPYTITRADQFGNNLVPYRWIGIGPMSWFGQDVLYWTEADIIPQDIKEEVRKFDISGREEKGDYILNNRKW